MPQRLAAAFLSAALLATALLTATPPSRAVAEDGDRLTVIPVGSKPVGTGISPDGRRLYVANSGDATVSVVDIPSATVVATVPTLVNPTSVAVSPDGSSVWVGSDESWTDQPEGITVIDAATLVPRPIEFIGVSAVDFRPDGREVWASLSGYAGVEIFDTRTFAHSRLDAYGAGASVSFDSTSSRAYVTLGSPNSWDNGIATFDARTHQEIDYPGGPVPFAQGEIIADGTRLYTRASESALVITDLSRSTLPFVFRIDQPATGLAVDGIRERLVLTTHNQYAGAGVPKNTIMLLDIASSRTSWSMPTPTGLLYPSVAADGTFAFASSPETGEVVRIELPPPAVADAEIDRIAGTDRYDTAILISREAFDPGEAAVAYLATGENFPDALSAAPAAARVGAPVLLTPGSRLPDPVLRELERLEVDLVKVVGGTSSVSEAVAARLQDAGLQVQRIAGPDRYATSRAIIADAFTETPVDAVYVATGEKFPDALSAAAAAGSRNSPVLLVPPALAPNTPDLDTPTHELIMALKPREAIVVGGTSTLPASISWAVERSVEWVSELEQPTRRLWGHDRFETSKYVSADAFGASDRVFLATGYNYPDALAGAALAASVGAPLFATRTDCIPDSILRQIGRLGADRVTLLGGTSSLDQRVEDLIPC